MYTDRVEFKLEDECADNRGWIIIGSDAVE
jgi:hypothetical protein